MTSMTSPQAIHLLLCEEGAFHTNQKIDIRHAVGSSGWQVILGKKRGCMSAETWFPNRALMWEPQPDMSRLLALELVAASDSARKFSRAMARPILPNPSLSNVHKHLVFVSICVKSSVVVH